MKADENYEGNGNTAVAERASMSARMEAEHDHDAIPTDLPQLRTGGVIVAALVIVAAFVGLFILGWVPRSKRLAELNAEAGAAQDLRPIVDVAAPKRTAAGQDLILPADARSFQETSIFPRATGYLKKLNVDIGDRVQAGQIIAEIDTPDMDADLNQARAQLAQSQANLGKAQQDYNLAQTTVKRYEEAGPNGGITQQELDERRSAYTQAQSALEAAHANVKAADANVQRLVALQEFKNVAAPFSGTITARNYDVGALMSASNSAPGKELFRIADTDTLRVFVNVPQTYVTSIKTGQPAQLSVRNYPGREFTGVVARTAGTLDPMTRTLKYEIDFPNKDGVLYAGMYAQARLKVSQAEPPMVVPTNAMSRSSRIRGRGSRRGRRCSSGSRRGASEVLVAEAVLLVVARSRRLGGRGWATLRQCRSATRDARSRLGRSLARLALPSAPDTDAYRPDRLGGLGGGEPPVPFGCVLLPVVRIIATSPGSTRSPRSTARTCPSSRTPACR
jgi:RND family efflux transporter MFP subunit